MTIQALDCPFFLGTADRAWLHERIAQRFDAMLAAAAGRGARPARARRPACRPAVMRCVGYRQAWELLDAQARAGPFR
jgi:tRNA dimethylallyltransferase